MRALNDILDGLARGAGVDFIEERTAEAERQLHSHAERGRLIQGSLTSFYVSLGLFVGTTIAIVLAALLPRLFWLPSLLGIAGTLALFHGSVLLIAETRLALRSVDAEMEFIVRVNRLRQSRRP